MSIPRRPVPRLAVVFVNADSACITARTSVIRVEMAKGRDSSEFSRNVTSAVCRNSAGGRTTQFAQNRPPPPGGRQESATIRRQPGTFRYSWNTVAVSCRRVGCAHRMANWERGCDSVGRPTLLTSASIREHFLQMRIEDGDIDGRKGRCGNELPSSILYHPSSRRSNTRFRPREDATRSFCVDRTLRGFVDRLAVVAHEIQSQRLRLDGF